MSCSRISDVAVAGKFTVGDTVDYRHGRFPIITRKGIQMFVIRFVVLAFLAFFSYSMGQETGGLNAFGHFIVFSGIVFIPAFYMLPTFEAWLREHPNLTSIALLNLFLGWTLLGWVAALVWSFKRQESYSAPNPVPTFVPTPRKLEVPETKACPYCAEQILVAAVKCKHCGSEIPET